MRSHDDRTSLSGSRRGGKTAFRERFIRDRFTGIYRATIGCDFLGRVVQVEISYPGTRSTWTTLPRKSHPIVAL
jgi:hypothetical protein